MGKIDDSARLIIKIAHNKYGSSREVAKVYQIPVSVVDQYLLGVDQGTLVGREIIRKEIGLKQGRKVTEKDKYKGGR